MRFAVIPAAGDSTRMGKPKLSLPLAGHTVLQHVVGEVRAAGIEHVVVVVGPHVSELVVLAESAGADALLLENKTPDMRATVEAGLRWLEQHFSPALDDLWLLLPADHPTVDAKFIRRLLEAATNQPQYSLVLPVFQGKRGHPAILRWKLVTAIYGLPPDTGLNHLFRRLAAETLEVTTDREEVTRDMDTPEQYESVRAKLSIHPSPPS
jgi:CTP:molybdopterin cytidylyltransferase MocA